MKKLYINPVTREIAPKHRSQKSVYIAKKDHNSVMLWFEIPKIVDGCDMSASENIIHIHYANIDAVDETKVSKGMSEATNVTVDEADEVVSFAWRIPNTATRYAGAMSIGITFERYEEVDGATEEVYSWSTSPCGIIVVQDSMDNSADVCDKDYDYLVETCNAIVSKSLGDVIEKASNFAESAKNSAEKAEQANSNVSKAEQRIRKNAEDTQFYAEQAEQSSQSADNHRNDAELAKDEATRQAELARGYVDTINLNLFGNALKGTASGVNAVRIDDVSPILHTMDVTLSVVNLIDQEAFFSSNSYTITGEVGKTYIFSCVFKQGVNLANGSSGIYDTYDGGMENHNFFSPGNEQVTAISITIEEGHTYSWNTSEANASDVYESVYMVLTDVSGVGVKAYGKNILNYNHTDWQMIDSNNYVIPLNLPQTILTVSGKFKNISDAYIYIYKSTDNWLTQDFATKRKGIIANTSIYEVTFDVEPNTEYRLWTNKITYNKLSDLLEGIQIEVGGTVTAYEEYIEPVDGAVAVHPTTTLVADTKGVEITVEYNRDINNVIAKLESAIANL